MSRWPILYWSEQIINESWFITKNQKKPKQICRRFDFSTNTKILLHFCLLAKYCKPLTHWMYLRFQFFRLPSDHMWNSFIHCITAGKKMLKIYLHSNQTMRTNSTLHLIVRWQMWTQFHRGSFASHFDCGSGWILIILSLLNRIRMRIKVNHIKL